jgi:hypothetical protein
MISSNDSSVEDSGPSDVEEAMRQSLCETTLKIDWGEDNDGIFANVDSFVEHSEGNEIVQRVDLDLYWDDYSERGLQTMGDWEKLGKGIGNLQALQELRIFGTNWDGEEEEDKDSDEEEPPDFETLARVLRHVRQKITLCVNVWETRLEEGFARAIRGHPTIQRFETSVSFDEDSLSLLLPALATLPALESIDLSDNEYDVPAFEHPEHLTTLLLSTSLRSVTLRDFDLTNAACKAVAHALTSGSPVTRLYLDSCHFPECGGGRSIVHALQRNSMLEILFLTLENGFDESIGDALASLLLVNTTLTDLTVHTPQLGRFCRRWLHPFLVALRINTSLKKLHVNRFALSDESVCGALRDVFSKNTGLEELTLRCYSGSLLGDTDVVAWRNTLPFLRHNKTLKSLVISVYVRAVDPHLAIFCFETVTMLKDNNSLECLDIRNGGSLSLANYFTALQILQYNTTLKKLLLHPKLDSVNESGEIKMVSDGEMEHFISLVKKNYGLESLDEGFYAHDTTGELRTILRLNQAGRRYLIEHAGSIASGVEVLITVSDDLDCLFYHLLENPFLCDIEHQCKKAATIADGNVHSDKRQRTSKL